MREIPEPKIVSENDDVHTVQLSEAYPLDEYQTDIEICTATISKYGAQIVRMSNNRKPKSFGLSMKEMDAICKAWIAFNTKREKAEKDREMIDKAYAIAKEHPEIIIYELNLDWEVSVPSIGFAYSYVAHHAKMLLEQAQGALDALDFHRASASQKADILDRL